MSMGSFVSPEFHDSVLSKVSEWNPFGKLPSFQETQRSAEVSETQQKLSELQEELRRTTEERSLDLEEFAKLKNKNGKSMQSMDKIRFIELQAEKAMASEKKMLESMVHQTRQLEQTKISLEEAKLEVRNLQENIKMLENSTGISRRSSDNRESLEPVGTHEEIRQLRNDLRLALEAEEKSRKAMDDFAVALKEVTTEANQTNAELAIIQSELEKKREEARCDNSLLKSTEQKLLEALDVYNRLKLEYEEYVAAWMEKEENLVNCVRISEEHLAKEKQENIRMNNAWKTAREENAKLREIIKQAFSEATTVKEELENARNENSKLKNQLFEKESVLQQTRQDYDSLKVSEAAALDRVREMKSLLASSSAADSNKTSKFSEIRSLQLSKSTIHGAKTNKCLRIFPSEKWKTGYYSVSGSRRLAIGESGRLKGYSFAKEGSRTSCSSVSDIQHPCSKVDSGNINLEADDLDGGKKRSKKKMTVLDRLTGSLRRRSTGN
ncbi:putative WEB family protein At1g65010, chloroplastic [Phalaenopsis equestris]|uniref:putative WEB family protein At1g65010, chloroplastic n=1 Tax=Phalaenopsis equestris TaxID=78828 RepID=UPI0009E436CE|nr:putative WEB family protein At1g65010, chloroplastic [Phalaenopsis equestris]XP_020589343.1 putative WEB family protein At1g65010, chloroplastic [Phalaenopsis equestris]XP_020589344.1 putative WEB family protein At1g65010, chloroplastic [Phalaenopsis equestris]